MAKRILLALTLLVILASLAACGGQQSNPEPSSGQDNPSSGQALERPAPPAEYAGKKSPSLSAADIEKGKTTYQSYCAACHGDKAMGDGPASASLDPTPQPLATTEKGLSDDYLYWRIAEGGLMDPFKSAMPSWKSVLDEDGIWQVIGYLRELGG
ncbi:MAG: cytochrome c [Anaerolineales bacterium]|jgi:mono/diheme cytochrome c family protein|nr:cytochrome c [Anaerolineales bacterium]